MLHLEKKSSRAATNFGFLLLFQTLDFGENLLQQIHPTALSGLHSLYGLRLAGNKLRNLTENVFEGVENLNMLNLASNLLQNISKKAFSALKELKVRHLKLS